jgi:hypothetical protein
MKYPDYFPGTIKHSASIENHCFFCALACVQESLKTIPKAENLFNDIVENLRRPGCRKITEMVKKGGNGFAKSVGRMTAFYVQKKRYHLAVARLLFLLKVLKLSPFLIFSRDVWNLVLRVRTYIVEVFNRNPKNPKVTMGANSVTLIVAVVIAAQLLERNIDPYEYDRIHNPFRAEMAVSRPTTREGRKLKTKYNKSLKDLGFQKSFDKHYTYGAKKWLLARVICPSAAEAAKRLQISWEQLYKDLTEFDIAMGYPRGR